MSTTKLWKSDDELFKRELCVVGEVLNKLDLQQ